MVISEKGVWYHYQLTKQVEHGIAEPWCVFKITLNNSMTCPRQYYELVGRFATEDEMEKFVDGLDRDPPKAPSMGFLDR